MAIQVGQLLISERGDYYQVIESLENTLCLKPLNGHTIFCCREAFATAVFHVPSPFEVKQMGLLGVSHQTH